jgi:glycosyltransferase involved in cell wall biosynthesis
MTKNIKLLISDNSLSEKLSRNARNKAEAFGWKILKNKWKNLFLGLE